MASPLPPQMQIPPPPSQAPSVAPVPPSSTTPPPGWYTANPYYAYTAAYYEAQRREQVERTGTGLLLIAIGFFLSWVPIISYIGDLVAFIGALLVILSRRAFGPKHARNVFWSIIVFVVGIASAVVSIFIASLLVSNALVSTSTFGDPYLYVGTVWEVFLGLIVVLFVYELELTTGRILLWVAYTGGIVTTIVNTFITSTVNSGITTNFLGSLFLAGLISLIPAVLNGLAYLLARERIVHGEIPTPQQLTR
jgi:hypothetical protein